jgi:hypothetical protein
MFETIVFSTARVLAVFGALVTLVAVFRRHGFSPGSLLAFSWLALVVWYALKGSFGTADPSLGLFCSALLSVWFALRYTGVLPAQGVKDFNSAATRALLGERVANRLELAEKRDKERKESEVRYVEDLRKNGRGDE